MATQFVVIPLTNPLTVSPMARQRMFGANNRWLATGEGLDEGGQAHIHVVTDTTGELSGEYVVKLLKNANRTPRLDNEIETTRRLHGAGCPVLDIVDDYLQSASQATRPWYVARRAEPGALAKQLQPGVPYGGSTETAITLYRDIVSGVLSLHAHNVAHRDLKPANILLEGEQIILADLGLALALGETEGERLTAELERIGSLHYTPPEAFSRRPMNQQQFAFDAFALGKILYEVLAGVPLPAFVSPTDPEYDLTRQSDVAIHRAVNRVLRGLLHDDPAVRMTYLGELSGQLDELAALNAAAGATMAATPQWHTALLSASDLLATRAMPSVATNPEELLKQECDSIAREAIDVWQSSGAVDQLEAALGTARGGHLTITRPSLGEIARSQLGGLQPTRSGLEPLEDAQYHFRPKSESGAHLSVASAAPDRIPFRHMWLFVIAAIKDGQVTTGTGIIRREAGERGTVDIVRDRLRVRRSHAGDAALIPRVRKDAEEMMATYVQDVIAEVRRVAAK